MDGVELLISKPEDVFSVTTVLVNPDKENNVHWRFPGWKDRREQAVTRGPCLRCHKTVLQIDDNARCGAVNNGEANSMSAQVDKFGDQNSCRATSESRSVLIYQWAIRKIKYIYLYINARTDEYKRKSPAIWRWIEYQKNQGIEANIKGEKLKISPRGT